MSIIATFVIVVGSAFIGWITNVLAIRMVFRPHQRVRILGPLGWQGVLPRKADRYAREVADMVVGEFFTLRDLVLQIDVRQVDGPLAGRLADAVDLGVEQVAGMLPLEVIGTGLATPNLLRGVKRALRSEIEPLLGDVRTLIATRIDSLVDLHAEIVANLSRAGGARLERLVLAVAGREFRWIERSGGVLGTIFGGLYVAFSFGGHMSGWSIPILGVVVGLVTNWVAIWSIFNPRHPVRIGPFRIQGVMPARQRAVADAMATTVREEMPPFDEIIDMTLERGLGGEVRGLLAERLRVFLESRLAVLLRILELQGVAVDVRDIANRLLDQPPFDVEGLLADLRKAAAAQVDIAGIVRASLEDMDEPRFTDTLRNLLREDEPILVGCGGVLGGLIGLGQLWFLPAF